jgi:protein LSM14
MPAGAVDKPTTSADTKAASKETAAGTADAATTSENAQPKQATEKSRVQPVLPLQASTGNRASSQAGVTSGPGQTNANNTLRDATQAATAAVAAAMAKLPPAQTNGNAVDNLTNKVNELRTNDPIRVPRHPGAQGSGFNQARGGRGGRGGHRNQPVAKVDVPTTDFDFESANAKFNKQDLVKEAIAGSPLGETTPDATTKEENPPSVYNKSTSFFDNISSEAKDRAEGANSGRPGGREWRGEEQKKNVETFGQGSVDNGYRGGYRGRGRGRGRGFRGRGYSNGLRGGYRGDRNDASSGGQ